MIVLVDGAIVSTGRAVAGQAGRAGACGWPRRRHRVIMRRAGRRDLGHRGCNTSSPLGRRRRVAASSARDRAGLAAVLVTTDARRTARELAAGTLARPRCAGRLAPWGHARERAVRLPGGASARVRPPRARCKACRVSFVLLPAWCAPRRGHATEVTGTAAAAAAGGYGPQATGSWLGVPEGTVRGWLRRLRGRAEELRGYAIGELAGFDSITPLPAGPAGSPPGDALDAVAVATRAAQRRPGHGQDMSRALAGRLGLCRFLQPARAG